ncbi:hypothetical protein PLESTF_001095700 [Pleodorina starrii]|nr:hypothetical protein PLESTF_001095700 [Pleodorina starrii]
MIVIQIYNPVIKGFDVAVTGLEVGGTRKQRIEPADVGVRRGGPERRHLVPHQPGPGGTEGRHAARR